MGSVRAGLPPLIHRAAVCCRGGVWESSLGLRAPTAALSTGRPVIPVNVYFISLFVVFDILLYHSHNRLRPLNDLMLHFRLDVFVALYVYVISVVSHPTQIPRLRLGSVCVLTSPLMSVSPTLPVIDLPSPD